MNVLSSDSSRPIVGVPDPHLAVLEDDQLLINTISQLTNTSVNEVRQRLIAEHRSLGENVRRALTDWNLPLYRWSDRLVDFYEQTDAFLYETTVWNRCDMKCQIRRWLAEFLQKEHPGGARVLCYGDGLGYDSLYLALAGHDVTYFEVSELCRQFASNIIARSAAIVQGLSSRAAPKPASFDAVVCLDVLEHVPDPPKVVGQLANLIRCGGTLLVHAPFFFLSPIVGTHLKANLRYSGDWRRLYAPYDLHPVDGGLFWNPLVLRKKVLSSNVGMPWRIRVGGWILSLARIWPLPHVLVCERLLARTDRRNLEVHAASLEASVLQSDKLASTGNDA